jgi:diguanylate cyclase (GGDEF)-like protein
LPNSENALLSAERIDLRYFLRKARGGVLTRGGVLLEDFARLAASVAGTSAAVIVVLGRRNDRGPTLAVFGLLRDQATTILEIDKILEFNSGLTIVPDLTQDERFGAESEIFGRLGIRFLGHLRLLSSGGEHIGFICVMDQNRLADLTEAQVGSLEHIGSMILADRRREQRHLHLMHVADRALRVDRMLRLVSEASSCADALTSLLEELCRFHGAAVGRIWQLIRPDESVQEISRFDEDDPAGESPRPAESIAALSAMTVEAIRRNEPQAISFSQRKCSEPPEDGIAAGFRGQVCVPVWVQQQRFGISLAFTNDRLDLDAVVADVASLGDTIRPALFRKVTEERIRFAAHHDDLTQLSNRLMFHERLRTTLASARSGGQGFALLYLDLDTFKSVNDTRGHEIGDKLLVAVAQRLRDSVREGDTVARMGGDEFAIVQPSGSQPSAATALAERLLETIGRPIDVGGERLSIGVSIGIALYPQDGEGADSLLRNADAALYRAKQAGRNTFRLFNPKMQAVQKERLSIEREMRDAIDGRSFTLVYQPVCDSTSLHIVGFEALLRWSDPLSGPIQPDRFIPFAEANGLIVPLGRWALESACAEAAKWELPASLSVNLSPLQFRQPDLPQQVADILNRTGLPAERLDLEVTEGLLLEESDQVLRTMRGLQEQGVRVTLDDFGTAYASLSYLRRFRFDGIKIDKSFIRGLCDDASTLAIVQAILSLGDRLNLVVVAEGVEAEGELEVLRKLGCRFVQGYLCGRPLEAQQARALLRRTRVEPDQSRPYAAAVK